MYDGNNNFKKIKDMAKNIFQKNETIIKTIALALDYDYDINKEEYKYGWFTQSNYFSAWFYLTNRFGFPTQNDDYKIAGVFNFKVKDFIIQINFSSSWFDVIIFGDKFHNLGGLSIYQVILQRKMLKNKGKILSQFFNYTTIEEEKLHEKHIKLFSIENNIQIKNIEKWTKLLTTDGWKMWERYVKKHNDNFLHIEKTEILDDDYSNAYTRRALKTLTQFLHNMLTPIWIRDVSYNIKGRCDTKYQKYINNIDITFINAKGRKNKY